MIAAQQPIQRPRDARLLVVDACGRFTHSLRSRFVDFLKPGDLVVANDAATLPASLHGTHEPSGAEIEVRLAGWPAAATAGNGLPATDVHLFKAVIFGAGDFRTRTEDRPLPPLLVPGDHLLLGAARTQRPLATTSDVTTTREVTAGAGSLSATVEAVLDHPRLVLLRFDGSTAAVWEGLARHGRPIQYTHVPTPLAMWDVWTPIAGLPVAFESPSASFVLDWRSVGAMRERGIAFATVTLAAGISSTGDPTLDRRLPLDEPYRISASTASAIWSAQSAGRRIVAVGTTVVRALEHAGALDGVVAAGDRVADQRLGPATRLRIVDAILSGTHEPDTSHYQLLRAFVDDETLAGVNAALETAGYRTHEFGDSVLIEKQDDDSVLATTINAEFAELAETLNAGPQRVECLV
jgi:S-adenosylmethionine:tRNA ribosyltransferase-isomerase